MQRPRLTIVIPVFNESEVLELLFERLNSTINNNKELKDKTEVIFVNDGSQDNSKDLIAEACQSNSYFSVVHFSRNFGHQQTVTAGMKYSRGDYVAVIDADLQDPPELIVDMLSKATQGRYDVVYAVRKKRKESRPKVFLYKLFYRVLSRMSTIDIPKDSGDFSLMSRRVVSEINHMPEYSKFIRGLRSYVGFKQVSMEYERSSRAAGKPKYTIAKLIKLASDGIFSFSEYPLKISMYLGWIVAIGSFLYATFLIAWRIFSGTELPGFATLAVAMFFLGGVQMIAIGVLGEYLGRVYNEVKNRPPYIIDEIEGAISDNEVK